MAARKREKKMSLVLYMRRDVSVGVSVARVVLCSVLLRTGSTLLFGIGQTFGARSQIEKGR